MTERLVVDIGADRRVTVSAARDGEDPEQVGGPVELVWPMDAEALEDLRWYLEDYLSAPFGVYGDRGPAIEARLPGWGEAIFAAVFGESGPARDAYVRTRTRTVSPEIVIRSGAAEPLGLPWELLRDPDRPDPVALDQVAVSRRLPTQGQADTFAVPAGERLRVLMVIARPAGAADVGYRMVARPLLDRLVAVRGTVELVVLRPPTFKGLEQVLRDAREDGTPFHIVHFDGHGVLTERPEPAAGFGPWQFDGQGPRGRLAFEKPEGVGADLVPAEDVARVLAAARVPVVVLNACQSGMLGKQVEAAVATRLLQAGAASVVAMAYRVYAVAVAEFMAAFYERLFAGDRIADAVSAGRRQLARSNLRPSPKGKLPLADWVVPVHYARRDLNFPGLRTDRSTGLSLEESLARVRESGAGEGGDPLDPVGTFVGRDGLFYALEVATRHQPVIVVHGAGGSGKTELVKAFGRWWRDTGGVEDPRLVLWHSFEPGVASFGLDGVVSAIGLRVFGAHFGRLEPAERRRVVRDLLVEHRLLLVWDNVETLHTMPDATGATPPLDDAQREELRAFLAELATAEARSAVLLTSRTPETWLGDQLRRIRISGLNNDEAIEYADALLAPYPQAAEHRTARAFGDLLEWLDGHPLSMRLILPQLETTDPATLLADLRGTTLLRASAGTEDDAGDRSTSLPASITYSLTHLDPDTQAGLAAVSLFHGVAFGAVLEIFSGAPTVPERFAGRSAEGWAMLLGRAADVGLLSPLGAGMYRIHPALPGYLAAQWRTQEPDTYHDARRAADHALLDAYAAFGSWLDQQISGGDAALAYRLLRWQRRTLGMLLGHALDQQLWDQAQAIAHPLNEYWNARGLSEEARHWVDRARLALETPDGTPPPLDSPAGVLWMFLVWSEATRQTNAGRPDLAESTYQQVRRALEAQPDSSARSSNLAGVYHQLGMAAQARDQLEEAEDWYHRSLHINEELGNRSKAAANYHQFGMLAQDRRQLEEAEDWYHRALRIKVELGDRPGTAISYHQLGRAAQDRRQLEEAEDWYHRALTIREELGDRPGRATSYHQLGIVAQLRGRLDQAEDWYRRSLTLEEEIINRPGMASSYGQLGLLAWAQGHPDQALEWTIRCIALFDQFPHPATGPAPRYLAEFTAELGLATTERTWHTVTGTPLPPVVREYLLSQEPHL